MKIKVLNIASILPFPDTKSGYIIRENDFLIVLSKYLKNKGIVTDFIKITNYSNLFLSKLSEKWNYYNNIPDEYHYNDEKISVIRQIVFPKNRFKVLRFFLSASLNKKKLKKFMNQSYTCSHAHYLLIDGYYSYYLYKKYNLPYVLTVRDETSIFSNFMLRVMAKKIINNAQFILTTNNINKLKLKEYTNKEIRIIPHGIGLDNLYFNPSVNKTIIITTVCKLNKGKRIDILLKALEKITDISYELNIIGDGPQYEYLKSISQRVNCNFLGRIEHKEVIRNLKKSDVFVLPSESESFGRVYIEALASSNAVVAVKDTGIYGLFENNTEVMYMERNSEDSLYAILNHLLRDKNKIREMKINGYKKIEKSYTWEKIANMYYDVYQNIDTSKELYL